RDTLYTFILRRDAFMKDKKALLFGALLFCNSILTSCTSPAPPESSSETSVVHSISTADSSSDEGSENSASDDIQDERQNNSSEDFNDNLKMAASKIRKPAEFPTNSSVDAEIKTNKKDEYVLDYYTKNNELLAEV